MVEENKDVQCIHTHTFIIIAQYFKCCWVEEEGIGSLAGGKLTILVCIKERKWLCSDGSKSI